MLKIEMPIEQAKLVAEACHFYVRMLTGDYKAVIDLCLNRNLTAAAYQARSKAAMEYMDKAKARIFSSPFSAVVTGPVMDAEKQALELKEKFEQASGVVTISDDQASLLSCICEFYARVKMGQFKEIIWYFLDMKLPSNDYCERRDEAEQLLLRARESIYPDLHGTGHSYGIGKFEDADKVYDVHQVIRYAKGHWREPFSYYPVPKCTVVQNT